MQTSRTFRIFVSSTFSDLKEERNALQERVFPRLRDLATAHGARFQAIDLRWGVSEEASLDQQTMNICLGEIARCQQISPRLNFIVLLGDRYGSRPLPFEIPREEFEKILTVVATNEKAWLERWYREDKNADPVVYVLQPRQSELSPIPSTAFNELVRAPYLIPEQHGEQRKILGEWYRSSDSAGPVAPQYFGETSPNQVVYILQLLNKEDSEVRKNQRSRAAQIVESHFWDDVETILHTILDKATMGFPTEARLKYVASATEQEIVKGVLRVPDAQEHVFCFSRKIKDLPQDASAEGFVDLDAKKQPIQDAPAHLKELEQRLRDKLKLPEHFREYEAEWKDNTVTRSHIPRLCLGVWHSLRRVILDEIQNPHEVVAAKEKAVHIRTDKMLDDEGLAHRKFAEEHLQVFVGREDMLAKIADYLTNSGRRCLAIVGAGGTGKSTLMARAIQQTQESHPKAEIVYRFIGATPGSSDGRSLLDSLCHEISRRYGMDEADIPTDYRDLVPELGKRMKLASADRPLILFLDSFDQLSASQDARSLIWLPNELPEHVSMIASTRPEEPLKALRAKQAREESLTGLSREEGNDLLSQWLASVHRTLQATQRQEVLDKFAKSEGNPLYLKLAFEEARLWPSDQPPEQLELGVSGIIEKNMINRLEKEGSHGKTLVSHALGYLATSRYGLAEDELLDLLSRDLQVYEGFLKKSYHFPADLLQWAIEYRGSQPAKEAKGNGESRQGEERAALKWLQEIRDAPTKMTDFLTEVLPKGQGPRLPIVLWSRLSFDLAPYLTERMAEGGSLLNFYHRELGDATTAVFLSKGKDQPYHEKLADYFCFKADPTRDQNWIGKSPRGLSELPYHLTKAARFDEVYKTLTDFKFLEHKVAEVGVLEREDEKGNSVKTYTGVLQIQEDYERALAAMPGGEGGIGNRAPLILTALETSKGLMVYCPVCNKYSPIENEMLDTVIACPQETCKVSLKLNPFTVKREI